MKRYIDIHEEDEGENYHTSDVRRYHQVIHSTNQYTLH